MKISANDIRPGSVLEHEGNLWRVSKTMHTQPGKGGAYMQVEMKDIVNGTKTNIRFRTAETVERAVLEQRPMQFLYADSGMLYFMDNTTYEQVSISEEVAGEQTVWLQENMEVEIEMYNDAPISLSVPDKVVLEIVEADAVVKGQTASSSYKPAKLENGETILVPPFIESGTRVVVNTADGSYIERA